MHDLDATPSVERIVAIWHAGLTFHLPCLGFLGRFWNFVPVNCIIIICGFLDRHIGWATVALAAILVVTGCRPEPSGTSTGPAADAPGAADSSWVGQARLALDRHDTARALHVFDSVLGRDPGLVPALGNRAALRAAMGDDSAALADYSHLLDIAPDNLPARDRRAGLLYEMGRHAEAIQDLQYLQQEADVDAPALWSRIAEARMALGEHKAALEAYGQALSLRPGWHIAQCGRADALFELGDFASAQAGYLDVIAARPHDSRAHNGLGLVQQFGFGELGDAEQSFRQALFDDPNNAGAWYNLGFLEAGRGANAAAISDFDRAILLDPDFVDAYLNRGLLQMRQGFPRLALDDFERACTLAPASAHAHMLRGWALCELGDRMRGCLDLATAHAGGQAGADDLVAKYCGSREGDR